MTMEVRVVSLQGIRQTWCGIVDIGPHSPKCDLQEVLIYVLCQVDMLCFPLVLVCPSWCLYSLLAHIIDLIEDNGGNAWDCAHLHGVWVRLYTCVCVQQSCVFCVLLLSPKGLRQISNCFKWARQLHILGCGQKRWIGLVELVNCTVLAGIHFCARFCLGGFVLLPFDERSQLLHVK